MSLHTAVGGVASSIQCLEQPGATIVTPEKFTGITAPISLRQLE
ncbi:MAG: hypothetical protein ACK5SQ_06770 [Chitinophagales bacterium]